MPNPNNEKKRWQQLLERWREQQLLDAATEEKLSQRLLHTVDSTPWYVRFLVGIGAWLAAIFFSIFLGVTEIYKNHGAAFVFGAAACLVAAYLLRQRLGDFVEQILIAGSLVGQILMLFGLSKSFSGRDALVQFLLIVVGLQSVMFLLNTSLVLRFLAVLFGSTALFGVIHQQQPHAIHALVIVYAALLPICWWMRSGHPQGDSSLPWFGERGWLGTKENFGSVLGNGIAVSLVCALIFSALPEVSRKFRVLSWIPSAVGIGAVWLGVVWRLLQREQKAVDIEVLVVGCGMLLFCGFSYNTPGVLIAGLFGTLGFAERDRFLMGLGVVALLFFLSAYYYNMNITLLVKSFALMIPGLILLGLYRYLRFLEAPSTASAKEQHHA